MIRLFLLLVFFVTGSWSGATWAQANINMAIPQSQRSFQSDRVRAGDVECSAAIGSSTNVEFGVVGILNENDPLANNQLMLAQQNPEFYNTFQDDFVRDVGVYARITIPIGAPKERLDCSKLYKLELEKKRLEVLKLRQEVQQLRQLKFEN